MVAVVALGFWGLGPMGLAVLRELAVVVGEEDLAGQAGLVLPLLEALEALMVVAAGPQDMKTLAAQSPITLAETVLPVPSASSGVLVAPIRPTPQTSN